MINWQKTEIKYGITNNSARSKSKVVVECDECGVEADRIYCSVKQTLKRTAGRLFCHNCATKSQQFKDGCATRAAKKWQDQEYIANNLSAVRSPEYREQKRSESAERWSDADFRAKMTTHEMIEARRRNSSIAAKNLWAQPEYRAKLIGKLRERMIETWQRQDYRTHMSAIQSGNTKSLWEDGAFADCFDDAFKEKMAAINREILSRPEVLEKLTEAGRANWENDEYRQAVIAGNKARWQNEEHRELMAQIRSGQPRQSTQQQLLYQFLGDLGVTYYREGQETKIGYFVFDCLVEHQGLKILIECQGDYWHSLPGSASRDKAKFTYVDRYFPEYEVMYIWEHEFYTKDRVLDRLKLRLGLSVETVDFRFQDIQIKEVSAGEVKSFLDAYHYIGKGRGGKTYGAYLGDLLVACVVFSPPLRQNMGAFGEFRELSRCCIHPSYHRKNFASWFISRSLRLVGGKVVAYADSTVGHTGAIYKASNFKLHHEVDPDYWYVDGDGFVMHKRTLYGRAVKMGMAESEFVAAYGYVKKFGGPKRCFVYG